MTTLSALRSSPNHFPYESLGSATPPPFPLCRPRCRPRTTRQHICWTCQAGCRGPCRTTARQIPCLSWPLGWIGERRGYSSRQPGHGDEQGPSASRSAKAPAHWQVPSCTHKP